MVPQETGVVLENPVQLDVLELRETQDPRGTRAHKDPRETWDQGVKLEKLAPKERTGNQEGRVKKDLLVSQGNQDQR
jgi:hypothetical protein